MRDAEKACDGGRTIDVPGTAWRECLDCGTRVRWDLVDHPFFGFQHCPRKTPDPHGPDGDCACHCRRHGKPLLLGEYGRFASNCPDCSPEGPSFEEGMQARYPLLRETR